MATSTIDGVMTEAAVDARIRRAEARLEEALRTQHRELTELKQELTRRHNSEMHALRQEARDQWHAERMRRLDNHQKVANVVLSVAVLASIVILTIMITLGVAE